MSLFNKFDKYELPPSIKSVGLAVAELMKIKSLKLEPFVEKVSKEKLHKILSEFLYKAVQEEDYNCINTILDEKVILKSQLLDNEGHTILEHCIKNSKNKVFFTLFNKHLKSIESYLVAFSELLTLAVNKKNYEMIDFLLHQDDYKELLKKENLINVFFVLIEGHQLKIAEFFLNHFDYVLDISSVEATMIYFIANAKLEEFESLFNFNKFIKKIGIKTIEKMVAYSVLNKNQEAIKIMLADEHFMDIIESSDPNMQKSIMGLLSYDKLGV